jgi:hypothetical protein
MRKAGMRIGLALVLAVAGTLATPPAVDAAAVLCQRKAKLRLRDGACKPKETPVQLAGTSVETATLGQVPSAAQAAAADSATTTQSAETAADADLLGGLAPESYQQRIRWALVSADGLTIIGQSGGIAIVAEPVTGIVVLDFGEDLRGRGLLATVRGGLANKGWAQAAICGGGTLPPNPETSFCNVGGSVQDVPNELAVATVDDTGAAVDRSFYVAVVP